MLGGLANTSLLPSQIGYPKIFIQVNDMTDDGLLTFHFWIWFSMTKGPKTWVVFVHALGKTWNMIKCVCRLIHEHQDKGMWQIEMPGIGQFQRRASHQVKILEKRKG